MATTADFRNGMCIVHNDAPSTILSFQHVKPGKGGAFVRTRLKNLLNGKIVEYTFNAGVKITPARIEHRSCQFLYRDGNEYHLMDDETFDNFAIQKEVINTPDLLQEGDKVALIFFDDQPTPIGCELPPFVTMKVAYTEHGIKGDTVTKTLKAATIASGANIQVPLFVQIGDLIKIDTRTATYVERVNVKRGA